MYKKYESRNKGIPKYYITNGNIMQICGSNEVTLFITIDSTIPSI